jgi:hypothetical protein
VTAPSDMQPMPHEAIIRKAEHLAGEVKLLAINLAVTLARVQNHSLQIRQLEPQFTELIRRANDTAVQVADVAKAFQHQKLMISSIPASSEIITLRGAFDKTEATLNYVLELSNKMVEILTQLQAQRPEGTNAGSR